MSDEDLESRVRRLEEMHRDTTPAQHREDTAWTARYRADRQGFRDFWMGTWKLAARIFLTIVIPAMVFWLGRALYLGLIEAVRHMSNPALP